MALVQGKAFALFADGFTPSGSFTTIWEVKAGDIPTFIDAIVLANDDVSGAPCEIQVVETDWTAGTDKTPSCLNGDEYTFSGDARYNATVGTTSKVIFQDILYFGSRYSLRFPPGSFFVDAGSTFQVQVKVLSGTTYGNLYGTLLFSE